MDVALALCFGERPLFFRNELLWSSYIAAHSLIGAGHVVTINEELSAFTETLDERLATIQKDLHEFSLISNLAYQTKRNIDPDMFNEMMVSILYRLLYLEFQVNSSSEMIRIAMVAFASSIYLRRYVARQQNNFLANSFRDALVKMQSSEARYPPAIELWLLFMFALYAGVGSRKIDWLSSRLEQTIQLLDIRTWDDAKRVLKSVMWIDFLHDPSGRAFFES